jgi:DNA-binding response OmpR family regulator
MRVLLVEDHEFLAQITCSVLREIHEYEVEHVSTAAAAVDLASEKSFDVILIDLNLPDMNGYKLAALLRRNTRLNDTVLVALTGIGSHINADEAMASGIDAYYTKPMDFTVLEHLKRDGRRSSSSPTLIAKQNPSS